MSSTINPTSTRPSHGRVLRRLGSAAVAAVALAGGLAVATPAQAAGGGYNPSFLYAWNWGDCSVKVGVVRDVYSPWAAIGGSSVTCSQRHSSTKVTVVQLFNGNVVSGSSASTSFANSYGTGGRILETPRFCGGGYWSQRATVTISGLGAYTFTTPQAWVQTGC
ncbi:hypothetical protein [uncultured Friedmanniella sp.]|uniref:hypothetical protein n=1 Tax=uncultured Friedmanniella sp. TaxID=335381 RepID=UPI0035CC83B5